MTKTPDNKPGPSLVLGIGAAARAAATPIIPICA
jgi:hypothetical protein